MKNKQSLVNMIFVLITLITIVAKSLPVNSTVRLALTVISVILLIPYIVIMVKDKMFNNRLNLFTAILSIFQVINILYYTYILKK